MNNLLPSDPTSIGGYPLLGRLGAGGMGQVFLSRTGSGRLLALKTIRDDLGSEPGFEERFAREISNSDRVRSPWTVTVVDYSAPGRRPQWLATEYVPAPSLAEWVTAHGVLSQTALLSLAAELCGALRAVHQAGLAHRDVKPGNILLARDRPRLIDFGIARAADDTRHTRLGVSVGSPGFLAPDQAVGGVAAAPADVFSLAAVLVYAATGHGPFSRAGEQIPAATLLYRVVHEEPDLEGVPPELVPLLTACLAKDPAVRPTAAQLGGWLEERGGRIGRWPEECPTVLAGKLTEAEHSARTMVDLAHHSTAALADQDSAGAAARSDTVLATPAEPVRRRPPAWLLTTAIAAVAVVVAVAATVYFGTQRSSAKSSPSAQGRPSGSASSASSATEGKTPSASAQKPRETQQSQESQKSQEPKDKGAALKVIRATFELAAGESVAAGARSLTMQQDGNLVVSDQDHEPRWAAMTKGEGNSARFQADGNLVVYDSGGQFLWSSRTNGHQGAVLVFQVDGNVVIKSGDTVLWAAGTES
ncbi:protein kinase domain-containing protein [Streptomyces rugosispiralis]|uniref:Protein kinase n=1 Tax=Streptomyces rugosispiralis TaxID=2967341 RepID=A0ABT1V755_9ACTN|nr:protein kinase [Streptomyces rugosispiralis]MCQ8193219.1 protein kinase [Streptomyces rugosispiralis]